MSASASPFNPRLVMALIAASIAAFGALLLLLAYAEEPGPPGASGGAAPSRSAVGYAGLVELVGRFRNAEVVTAGNVLTSDDLLVVAVTGAGGREAIVELLRRRGPRATLLIMPKWMTRPDPARRGWVRAGDPLAGQFAARLIGGDVEVRILDRQRPGRPIRGDRFVSDLVLPLPAQPQVIGGGDLTPLVHLPSGDALLAQIGAGPHYVLADPDILNNHGLRSAANARAALRLLDALNTTGSRTINFDLTTGGRGGRRPDSPSLLRLAFEPPLLAMTLALLFAALLAGYYGIFRFGPVRRERRAIAFGKAALVENSAGLIRLARREARLGAAYADVVRSEAARLASTPAWLGGDKLDAYLDRVGRPGEARFTELAGAMARADDRTTLMDAARALHRWKRGLVK
ncbi:MAG: DUF4350 domain-containing protein [Sphingomonas sp.]